MMIHCNLCGDVFSGGEKKTCLCGNMLIYENPEYYHTEDLEVPKYVIYTRNANNLEAKGYIPISFGREYLIKYIHLDGNCGAKLNQIYDRIVDMDALKDLRCYYTVYKDWLGFYIAFSDVSGVLYYAETFNTVHKFSHFTIIEASKDWKIVTNTFINLLRDFEDIKAKDVKWVDISDEFVKNRGKVYKLYNLKK